MTNPVNIKIKKVATAAVRKAGRMLRAEFKKFNRASAWLKSKHEIVTKADLKSEKIIIGILQENFPDHQILSEESGLTTNSSDYLWVVDPLDGTTNFSIHNPLWSVSLGLAYKKKIVLGLVYAPVLDELFMGELGRGATNNNKKIKVSQDRQEKQINTFCHGSRLRDIEIAVKYMQEQKIKHLDCRQLGSAAIELAYVASGRVESIMIPGAHSWDVAAGILLVREAGGRVTDFSGKEWNLNSEDMLASNSKVHREILRIIRKQKL